jgi:NodT family efflux transporter outer membrane factor (OMF) lipoprotein
MAISACSVGPEYVPPPVTLNENWKDSTDTRVTTKAAPDSAWWGAFDDPTLDRLIDIAYQQNLPLQTAGLRIMESRARLALAAGRQYPQIQELFASAMAVGLSENAANSFGLDNEFWDFQVGFDVLWEVDIWKKYGRGVQAEAGRYFASAAAYDDALVSLTAEVARTYTAIRTLEVLLDQARRNAELQEEGLRIADSRFRNGATSELDVAQAATLFESTRATIPQLEAGLYQAQNALSTLLGMPTGSGEAILAGGTGIPSAPALVEVSMPAELLRRRPDIRNAALEAYAQSAQVGVATADLYPRFLLFGTIGTQTSDGAGNASGGASFSNLFGVGSWFYSIGPRLVWPIFNYGRTRNTIRIEDARLQQLLVEYQDTVLRAAQEVEDGLTGYLKSQEAEVFARNAAAQAGRAAEIAMVQYREGAVDYQRVLDADRVLLEEENAHAQALSAIATNLISLYKALGGGWEIRNGRAFVSDRMREEMQERTNWGDLFTHHPELVNTGESNSNDR